MPHGWVYWSGRDHGGASLSRAEREDATSLAAREERAEQAGTRALADGDWIAAAELEEERVVRQHERAVLLLEQRVQPADE